MGVPTTSLQTLRRAIGRELRMDFYRRYPAGYVTAGASCTSTKVISSALTQEDDFWSGAWLYHVTNRGSSLISQFSKAGTHCMLETALANVPAPGDQLEILNIWNAYDILGAINMAIKEVNRVYYDNVVDETLVIQEKTLKYDLSTLTKSPWAVAAVYIENVTTVKRGTVQSATATSLTVEAAGILSTVNSNWMVSIYAGTGKGQLRQVTSVLGADANVVAWTVTPDTTSKYCLWDPTQQVYDWIPTPEFYLDSKEFPTYLNLKRLYMTNYGLRIRIAYIALASELVNETDTTIIPQQYVVYKACSYLHGQALNNTKMDHNLHQAEAVRYDALSKEYEGKNAPHKPDFLMKSAATPPSYFEDDPLAWFNKGG